MPKEKLDYIRRINPKIVSVDGCHKPYRFDCVVPNLAVATKDAIDCLINLGHKDIGFIGGNQKLYYPEYSSIDIREQAIRDHMLLKGLLNEEFIYQ